MKLRRFLRSELNLLLGTGALRAVKSLRPATLLELFLALTATRPRVAQPQTQCWSAIPMCPTSVRHQMSHNYGD